MKTNEEIIKEAFQWMWAFTYKDTDKLRVNVNMPPVTSYEIKEAIQKALELKDKEFQEKGHYL